MTDPKVVEAMAFVQDLMWTKHVAPRPDERDAVNANNGGFASGTYSMAPGGTWNIASYTQMKDEWAMAPLPLYQGQSTQPYWLGGWVVPAKSGAITAAQTFAIWSATKFQSTMATNHDWIPLQTAARESKDMLERDAGRVRRHHEGPVRLPGSVTSTRPTCSRSSTRSSVPTSTSSSTTSSPPQDAAQKMQDAATKLLT